MVKHTHGLNLNHCYLHPLLFSGTRKHQWHSCLPFIWKLKATAFSFAIHIHITFMWQWHSTAGNSISPYGIWHKFIIVFSILWPPHKIWHKQQKILHLALQYINFGLEKNTKRSIFNSNIINAAFKYLAGKRTCLGIWPFSCLTLSIPSREAKEKQRSCNSATLGIMRHWRIQLSRA